MGAGGVLDHDLNFVKESGVTTAFGGKYEFEASTATEIDETVIYIPIIPKHWGHFLIDVLCRFWFVIKHPEYKILFCMRDYKGDELDGNYLETFRLLGIREDRLVHVKNITHCNKIIIPDATAGYTDLYCREFKDTIALIIKKALETDEAKAITTYPKIYFTRTNFSSARSNEVGEKAIENVFRSNGYKILSPEKLDVIQQIFYIHNAEIIASLSGTAAHNIVFKGDSTKLVIINRTGIPNPPQVSINQLFNVDCTYVDGYSLKYKSQNYGEGPFFIEINENLKKFFDDNQMRIPYSKYQLERIKKKNAARYVIKELFRTIKTKSKKSVIFLLSKVNN